MYKINLKTYHMDGHLSPIEQEGIWTEELVIKLFKVICESWEDDYIRIAYLNPIITKKDKIVITIKRS